MVQPGKALRTAKPIEAEPPLAPVGDAEGKGFYGDFLPYVLASIVHKLQLDLLADLKKYKISVSRWRVLAVLGVRDGRTISEIAELAMIRQSALSRAIVKMETQGLLRREVLKRDQRYVLIFLTQKGTQLFQKLFPVVQRRQEICVAGMETKDVNQLFALLGHVRDNLDERQRRIG